MPGKVDKPVRAAFWGKWGILNPEQGKIYFQNAYRRGYGQPLLTGRYATFEDPSTTLAWFARRWDLNWIKHLAMRADSERTPLAVLRRQIWLARAEYWLRRWRVRKIIKKAAYCEWAYVRQRLKQPFTWTFRDLQHGALFSLHVFAFFVLGERTESASWTGYGGVGSDWTPSRPMFAPGFYHIYDPFDNLPFEGQPNTITKQFQRGGPFPNNSDYYWTPHTIRLGAPTH